MGKKYAPRGPGREQAEEQQQEAEHVHSGKVGS